MSEAHVLSSESIYSDFLKSAQETVQQDLLTALAQFQFSEPLQSAVHHAVMLGGKRVRPALCYAVNALHGHILHPAVRRAAVAVELIHCYSLVHDDLPCMDNDSLRRGQPTCHVAFGEHNALLAGDVLQSMAYEVLTSSLFEQDEVQHQTHPRIVLQQVKTLASASSKMVQGQVLDLQSEGIRIDQQALEAIHHNKTGALISAAILMSAQTMFEPADQAMQKLEQFGQHIGLAFQVQDDILDITSNTNVLGKTAGKDLDVEKSTYPALMGLIPAQNYLAELHAQALAALSYFEEDAQALQEMTQFLLLRKS